MGKLLVPFRGVVEIVAGHDVGKTIAALQTVYPYDKTVFVDDDEKGSGIVEQMKEENAKFEKYIDLAKRRMELGNTPTADELLDKVVYPTIGEITEDHHDVIIWDTFRIVYQAARGHVAQNQNLYKNVVNFRGTSSIIQGLISKVARMIEGKQLSELRSKCDLLVITHHLKANYSNNVVVGKIPESSRTISEICNMRIWLRRNPKSKVPIMLFLKRPTAPKIVNGKMSFVNIVPMKITPTADDESIWDAIARYGEEPIESREARPDETPSEEEFAMLKGTLTDDQKQYVAEILKYQKEEEEVAMGIAESISKSKKDEVDIVFPPLPETGAAFIARCMKEFNMNGEAIKKELGLGINDIMEADTAKIKELWEKLSKKNGK